MAKGQQKCIKKFRLSPVPVKSTVGEQVSFMWNALLDNTQQSVVARHEVWTSGSPIDRCWNTQEYQNTQQLKDVVQAVFETIAKAKLRKISHRTWRRIILCHENDSVHTDLLDVWQRQWKWINWIQYMYFLWLYYLFCYCSHYFLVRDDKTGS